MIINNTEVRLIGFEEIVLMPGANEVEDSMWGKMEKHPTIKSFIDEGILVVVASDKKHQNLSSLSPKEALDLVKSSSSKEILSKFLKDEKRPAVKKAIEEQLSKIDAAPEYRDTKKEEKKQDEE